MKCYLSLGLGKRVVKVSMDEINVAADAVYLRIVKRIRVDHFLFINILQSIHSYPKIDPPPFVSAYSQRIIPAKGCNLASIVMQFSKLNSLFVRIDCYRIETGHHRDLRVINQQMIDFSLSE